MPNNSNRNGQNGRYPVQVFIDAIQDTGGIISAIAKKVGCDWHTAKRYCTQYATVKQAYEDECERVLDLAESKVIVALKEGDGVMIRYYLSTKGKERGYVERKEVTGDEGGPVIIQVVYDDEVQGPAAPAAPETK
jgi:hypothetical protein